MTALRVCVAAALLPEGGGSGSSGSRGLALLQTRSRSRCSHFAGWPLRVEVSSTATMSGGVYGGGECGQSGERAFLSCGVCNRRPQPSPSRRPFRSPPGDPGLPAPSPPRALPASGAHPARRALPAPGVAAPYSPFQPGPAEEPAFRAARGPGAGRSAPLGGWASEPRLE